MKVRTRWRVACIHSIYILKYSHSCVKHEACRKSCLKLQGDMNIEGKSSKNSSKTKTNSFLHERMKWKIVLLVCRYLALLRFVSFTESRTTELFCTNLKTNSIDFNLDPNYWIEVSRLFSQELVILRFIIKINAMALKTKLLTACLSVSSLTGSTAQHGLVTNVYSNLAYLQNPHDVHKNGSLSS